MKPIDLGKQQALNVDPKGIQQINFTGNLDQRGQTAIFFIIEKVKETILKMFERNCESIVVLFCFNTISI